MYVTAGREVSEVAREIVATITDPRAMVGPEVNFLRFTSRASLLFVRCTYTDLSLPVCVSMYTYRRDSSTIKSPETTPPRRRSVRE